MLVIGVRCVVCCVCVGFREGGLGCCVVVCCWVCIGVVGCVVWCCGGCVVVLWGGVSGCGCGGK